MKFLKALLILSLFTMPFMTEAAQRKGGFSFEIAPEFFHYSYEEDLDGQYFMDVKGPMFGVNALLNYASQENDIAFSMRYASGEPTYNSNRTGRLENDPHHYTEFRLTHGYHFTLSPKSELIPFWGIGYRFLVNDGDNIISSTGHSGYYRSSRYFYMPLGAIIDYKIDSCSRFTFSAEYDSFFGGIQRSVIGGIALDKAQNTGRGFRVSLGYQRDLSKYAVEIKPFYRYWNIDDSEHVIGGISWRGITYYMEPHNVTKEFGVSVSLKI